MKLIINSKRYDTETATRVAHYTNDLPYNDGHYVRESLCLTGKGNWFLYCEGGSLSQYSEVRGNFSFSGETLRALSQEDAQRWLEDRKLVEKLEQYFSDSIEDA